MLRMMVTGAATFWLMAIAALVPAQVRASEDLAADKITEWFAVDDEVRADWIFHVDPTKAHIVRITRDIGALIEGLRVEPQHRVLVLYPKPSSAYDTAISKILTVFAERAVDVELLAINFGDEDAMGHRALNIATGIDADLIISMGSQSTAWLWENYRDGEIPVVSVTSKDPVILGQAKSYDQGTGSNFAFTSLNMPVEAQLAYVMELRPDLKNLAVLVDSTNVSALETQARPISRLAVARGVRVLSLEVQDRANAKAELRDLVSGAVAAMRKNDPSLENSLFWITGSTSVFNEIATINTHSDRVPVLSVVPEVVRAGTASAVLSVGISFDSNAHIAAIYAVRILEDDTEVGALPVGLVSPPDIAINFQKAREIGLAMPFSFVEGAAFIYDYDGQPVRVRGVNVRRRE